MQTGTESKTRLVEQINLSLRAGDYSRTLDLLRGSAAEFPNDTELCSLEKLAHEGLKRNAEANRLITESQELFAERNTAKAIQLLREAYELDKNNVLARSILANALVEQAHSLVESDWLEAETLTNQALNLNPAHPTAKTIHNLVVDQKKASSVEDWIAHARKRQSTGDVFAALAWVAEGLAVHPDDPKLLQIQDEVQRDQATRRRQARRGDIEDLRRMEREIHKAADAAAKQALAERIQMVAAKHWTDGEILSIANALLLRLGLIPQVGSVASSQKKAAAIIFHVPRPSAAEAARGNSGQISTSSVATNQIVPSEVVSNQVVSNQVLPSQISPNQISPHEIPAGTILSKPIPSRNVPSSAAAPNKVPPSRVPARIAPQAKALSDATEPLPRPAPTISLPAAAPAKVARVNSPSSQPPQRTRNSTTLILVCASVVILVAAVFIFGRKYHAPLLQKPADASTDQARTISAPLASAPAIDAPAATTPEPSLATLPVTSGSTEGTVEADDQPPPDTGNNRGTLIVVAGQDDARVFLNGKPQRQLTRAGQLRLPDLEPKDYTVQVSKSGFQDPAPQKIRVRSGEQARLVFHLQPNIQAKPRLASLIISGGVPGTTVLVDQTLAGAVQPDGTLTVSTINPGDHTVELRKEGFQPRQFKKHFVLGATMSLAAVDAALDAASGELKITFAPADARVAIVKGERLTIVSSGVPLTLGTGTYTLTARNADSFTRSSTFDVIAGQSKTLDLSLAPNDMSKWADPGAWKHEGNSFIREGGDFVLYGVAPTSGTFAFSAMPIKGRILQWVLNYTDPKNYVLFQMDDNNFYRTVIRNGQKTDEIIVPDKSEKKSFRTLHIRVSPAEIVHQIKHGDSWRVLDRWTQPGANLSLGKFGFYIPGNDQVAVSSFAHYAELNIR